MSLQSLSFVRTFWCKIALFLSVIIALSVIMPSAKAQDGGSDPVTSVEITIGSGSIGGVNNKTFAWRDKIDSVVAAITCKDANGKVVAQAPVSITVTSPGAVNPTSGTTDSNGSVSTSVSSTDINLDSTSVTVTATSEKASGTASVLLKGIQVVFGSSSIRMGVFKPATATATVTPAYDAANVGITTVGQSRAAISATSPNTTSGTIALTLTGKSGTPASSPQGDEWLAPNIPGSNIPREPIVVIVPAAIATPHPTFNNTVTATNMALDATTSPAEEGVPSKEVYLCTVYITRMTIQVVDQFGKNLDALYSGAPVTEDNGIAINVSLSSSGTYLDPVGPPASPRDDGGPVEVPSGGSDANQWTSVMYTHHAPIRAGNYAPQNFAVSIAGIPLSPAIVGRTVTAQAPNLLTITWPN